MNWIINNVKKLKNESQQQIQLCIMSALFFFNIVNLLDFNLFYFRLIISFFVLTFVPGFLLFQILQIKTENIWEKLIYSISFSILILLLIGLLVNTIGPFIGINKPLSILPMLLCFDILIILLLLIIQKRKILSKPVDKQLEKLSFLNRIFFIIPITFPLIAIIGTLFLNNNSTNIINLSLFLAIGIYVFIVVLLRKKLNINIYAWSILLIGFALLLTYSLRSNHILGWDINVEYYVFQLTKTNAHWSMSLYPKQLYNACLSINILPTIFSLFLTIKDEYIFKLIFPMIFSFSSLIVFLLVQKFTSRINAFLAAFFFVSQIWFYQDLAGLARQEMAFIFFCMMIYVQCDKNIALSKKTALFIFFGIGLIMSHYSTSLLAIALFFITYIITVIFLWVSKNKIIGKLLQKTNLFNFQKKPNEYYALGMAIFSLIIIFFCWYAVVTDTAHGLTSLASTTLSNLPRIIDYESFQNNIAHISFNNNVNTLNNIKSYEENVTAEYRTKQPYIQYYNQSVKKEYPSYPVAIKNVKIKNNLPYNYIMLLFKVLKTLIFLLFIPIGVLYLIFFKSNKYQISEEFIIMMALALLLLFLLIISPSINQQYNVERLYMQFLVLLAFSGLVGALTILNFIRNKQIILIIISCIFIFSFMFYSGTISQFIGGAATISLNNYGIGFDTVYTYEGEVKSAEWLKNNFNQENLIYSDELANLRLYAYANISYGIYNLLPSIIDKSAYVYLSNANKNNGQAFKKYGAGILVYNYPNKFLNSNKNLIYNNGVSEIFK